MQTGQKIQSAVNHNKKEFNTMTKTEVKKPEFVYHAPPVEDFNNADYLITRIGVGTGIADSHVNRWDRYEIAFKRYKVEDFENLEEALAQLQKDRGIDTAPQALLDRLVGTMFTAPDYHSVLCYQIGDIEPDGVKIVDNASDWFKVTKDNGHELAQSLADGFTIGQRAAGPSQKKIVAEAKQAEKATGMSTAEMAAKILEMKSAGLLD